MSDCKLKVGAFPLFQISGNSSTIASSPRWWYSDAERLRALEQKPGGAIFLDFLARPLLAHFGPYQAPWAETVEAIGEKWELVSTSIWC